MLELLGQLSYRTVFLSSIPITSLESAHHTDLIYETLAIQVLLRELSFEL